MKFPINIGSFPYNPGFNPYQRLATEAIEDAGANVQRIAPVKWFPVQHAFATPDCDLLHFDWPHDWYSGRNLVTRVMKRAMYTRGLKTQSEKKLVWTAHNLVAHDAQDLNKEAQMLQRLISRCDGIVVMSDASERELRRLYDVPKSTLVQKAPHGHYIDCYRNEIAPAQARAKMGIEANSQVFLSVGAIRRYKGHLSLIRTFGAIATPGQRLIIAGNTNDSVYRRQLHEEVARQSSINPNCQVDLHLRMIPDDELQVLFNASDICVLPFANILNSGSLLMAMSFGMPVVASNLGSIPEVAIAESSVLFSPDPHDTDHDNHHDAKHNPLANALIEAAKKFDRGDRGALRKSLIDRVREEYAWSHFGKSAVSLYETLLS